jgi:DNA-binding transcriptional MerR regulator
MASTAEPAPARPPGPEKGPDAFRTISEVADEIALPQHVLRFWESRFGQIRPLKRGGGRRYYRPEDVDLLRGIKHLLYGEGYTIRGVQRILKGQGTRFVQGVWRDPASLRGVPRHPADLAADAHDEDAAEAEAPPRTALAEGEDEAAPEPQPGARLALRPPDDEPAGAGSGLSREDVRRLKAALVELVEAKRILDELG